ncbi:hypothetical protein BJY16_006207 [Actinoplanes octamycinicus]|uniref:DUF4389 domain-containing protein n=1 Tax=Actinoplanes octamycinicus TaxID=135948 RepID=A0A7W7H2K3_9ACTN|nr:DUF4389 domain-containing protein [Actinoplanes octamycinicus]MBB4742748.1 hypothetical protein [Actinoplanes octamycinicus]GIE63048.1 hypothetical protein Aoc01nite_84500 [Actinoplanes octamycinicus]
MNYSPVRVEARPDPSPSRWLWLVKWLLLIPHYIVLAVLWVGLVVLTLVAYLAILFTGRYPPSIRAYNVGVLRWTWRVNYYGYSALGTDRYPPFTLADVPDYPARFGVAEPERVPRWLPLVAWLFAVPHLVLLGALTSAVSWNTPDGYRTSMSVLGAAVLILGVALLFTGRYLRGLHDLLVGVARWQLRVAAYLTLLTPRYPPFQLDQGGAEPVAGPAGPAAGDPPAVQHHQPATQPPPPDAPAGPPRSSPVGFIIALVAGVLLLAPATGLTIGGGALLALDGARDGSGYATSRVVGLHSTTAAITAENLEIAGADVWTRNLADVGGLRLTATAPAGRSLFVGIAPQQAVDRWLAGTAHDELVGMSIGATRYHRAAGPVQGVPAPDDQQFWLASASGPGTTTLNWTVTDGEFAVVVANLDGTPGVVADVRGAVQVPDLTAIGAGLLIAGIALGLVAIGLIVLGGVGIGRRHTPPPQQPQAPAPPPLSTISA